MTTSSLFFRTTTTTTTSHLAMCLRHCRTLYTFRPQFARPNLLLAPPPFRSFTRLSAAVLENAKLDSRSNLQSPLWFKQTKDVGHFAYKDNSDDDSDKDADSDHQRGSSTLDFLDEWKAKFTVLLRNQDEQEVVSRDKKDRHHFDQLSTMATRMGLHSRQYSKVIVFSKVPLPNYRPDLDDKRPQREVVLPFDLQKDVINLLRRHLAHKIITGNFPNSSVINSTASLDNHEVSYRISQPFVEMSAAQERILWEKSEQLQKWQQDWQV